MAFESSSENIKFSPENTNDKNIRWLNDIKKRSGNLFNNNQILKGQDLFTVTEIIKSLGFSSIDDYQTSKKGILKVDGKVGKNTFFEVENDVISKKSSQGLKALNDLGNQITIGDNKYTITGEFGTESKRQNDVGSQLTIGDITFNVNGKFSEGLKSLSDIGNINYQPIVVENEVQLNNELKRFFESSTTDSERFNIIINAQSGNFLDSLAHEIIKRKKYGSHDSYFLQNIAKNSNVTEKTLTSISKVPGNFGGHLEGVAYATKNPDLLRKLSTTNYEAVRGYVASNPNTPKDTMESLSKDKSEYVLSQLMYNPKINEFPSIVSRLEAKAGKKGEVWKGLISSEYTSQSIYENLTKGMEKWDFSEINNLVGSMASPRLLQDIITKCIPNLEKIEADTIKTNMKNNCQPSLSKIISHPDVNKFINS